MSNASKVIEYGRAITLEEAKTVMAAAELEAKNNNWAFAIAIVDSGGNLVLFQRMDHVQIGSVEVAKSKAITSINFKRSTKVFDEAVTGGGTGLRLLSMPGAVPLEGGELIIKDGCIIGAIGVSGMQSGQDGQVARAGILVIK